MKKIGFGIIGCGDVTEVKSGPAIQKAQGADLVAVMRRDAAKAQDYAKRHNVPRFYTDARKLIHDPEVDVVYVATPPDSHMEYCLMAAAAQKPVYVEKPMARTYEECRRMIDACSHAGVPLFVAYYRRRLPRFVRVKQLVNDGAIGEIRWVQVTLHQPPGPRDGDAEARPWRVVPQIAGAGKFLDLASHTLDALDEILGPITRASGQATNQARLYEAEDIVTGQWTHTCGALGLGLWCFASALRQDLNEIHGSRGKISFSTFGTEPVRLHTESGIEEFPEPTPPHVQQPLIQSLVKELLNEGDKCPSTGQSAARTSWVMDQMLHDWRECQKRSGGNCGAEAPGR